MSAKNAIDRAHDLMGAKRSEIPELAARYATYLCGLMGCCAEMLLTAYAHYAQLAEGLSCDDSMYKADDLAEAWFTAQCRL